VTQSIGLTYCEARLDLGEFKLFSRTGLHKFRDSLIVKSRRGPQEPCIWMGVQMPQGEWAFFGVVRSVEKHSESLPRYMQQKINNGITAPLLQPTALLLIVVCFCVCLYGYGFLRRGEKLVASNFAR